MSQHRAVDYLPRGDHAACAALPTKAASGRSRPRGSVHRHQQGAWRESEGEADAEADAEAEHEAEHEVRVDAGGAAAAAAVLTPCTPSGVGDASLASPDYPQHAVPPVGRVNDTVLSTPSAAKPSKKSKQGVWRRAAIPLPDVQFFMKGKAAVSLVDSPSGDLAPGRASWCVESPSDSAPKDSTVSSLSPAVLKPSGYATQHRQQQQQHQRMTVSSWRPCPCYRQLHSHPASC